MKENDAEKAHGKIRRAELRDIPTIDRLLYEVQKVHSDARSDLFITGGRKYTDDELSCIIRDERRPTFVFDDGGEVLGYIFCEHKQLTGSTSMTDIRTLYIDDLCVDEAARGRHIGTELYNSVLKYAGEHGYYNVTLNVWAGNENALKFYRSLGMRVQKLGMEKILDTGDKKY